MGRYERPPQTAHERFTAQANGQTTKLHAETTYGQEFVPKSSPGPQLIERAQPTPSQPFHGQTEYNSRYERPPQTAHERFTAQANGQTTKLHAETTYGQEFVPKSSPGPQLIERAQPTPSQPFRGQTEYNSRYERPPQTAH